jgi:DNA-directed RNA polymerase subunit H (RpoH/RPB5)
MEIEIFSEDWFDESDLVMLKKLWKSREIMKEVLISRCCESKTFEEFIEIIKGEKGIVKIIKKILDVRDYILGSETSKAGIEPKVQEYNCCDVETIDDFICMYKNAKDIREIIKEVLMYMYYDRCEPETFNDFIDMARDVEDINELKKKMLIKIERRNAKCEVDPRENENSSKCDSDIPKAKFQVDSSCESDIPISRSREISSTNSFHELDTIMVFWSLTPKIGTNIRVIQKQMENKGCDTAIIVCEKDATPATKSIIQKLLKTDVRIDIYNLDEAQNNIKNHFLVPEHRICSNEEKKRVKKIYSASGSTLPIIKYSDPMIKYLGAKKGQLIHIIRPSETYPDKMVNTWRIVS